jgi:Raf kinase inhibitor-like YbhB/YbcL family protein
MLSLLLLGCTEPPPPLPAAPPPMGLTVTSGLPPSARCGGSSPAIAWTPPPPETASLAVTLVEPSAQGPWVHWMAWDIPPDETGLDAGILATRAPATQGIGSSGAVGYEPPCPSGPGRYELRVFALDAVLGLPPTATWAELGAAIQPRTLSWGMLSIEVSGADD